MTLPYKKEHIGLGLYHNPHKRDDVALVEEITGTCRSCYHKGTARLTAYYSGEVVKRCNYCHVANQFEPDNEIWNDPNRFLPFKLSDEPEKYQGQFEARGKTGK